MIDLDIRAFFDSVPHELVLRAVRRHTDERWILLYVERWLKAPLQQEDGTLIQRDRGTPQGSSISPLLANLFLHYAFDVWMGRRWAWSKQDTDVGVDGLSDVHPCTHMTSRQIVRTYRQRQTDESERGNPRRCSQR